MHQAIVYSSHSHGQAKITRLETGKKEAGRMDSVLVTAIQKRHIQMSRAYTETRALQVQLL